MPPCDERTRLRPLIEFGGGTINSKVEKDCIRLAVPGQKVKSSELINSKYVTDCVNQNKLLDLENYRVFPDRIAKRHNDSSSDMDPADCIIRISPSKQGRSKYDVTEDMSIIRHLLDQRLYRDTSGNSVWKSMELYKVTNHTWQSMKDRFRRTIIPNIDTYMLSRREVALLTGTTVKPETDEEPGIIDDVSPPPRKKLKNNDSLEVVTFSKNSSLLKKEKINLDDFDKELVEQAERSSEQKLNVSRLRESNSTSSKKDRKTVDSPRKDSPKKVSYKSVNKELSPMLERSETRKSGKNSSAQEALTESSSSEDESSTRLTRRILQSKGKGKGKNGNAKGLKRREPITSDDGLSEESEFDERNRQNRRKTRRESVARENESEEEVISPKTGKSKKRLYSDEDEAIEVEEKEDVVELSEEEEKMNKDDDEEEDEEFSPSVIESGPPKQRKSPYKTYALSPKRPQVDKSAMKIVKKRDSRKTSASRSPLKNFILNDFSQPVIIDDDDDDDDEEVATSPWKKLKDEKLHDAKVLMKHLRERLDMTEEEMLAALWMTSGSVQTAVTWILRGGRDDSLIWTTDDDEDLQNSDRAKQRRLEKKFGPLGIKHRLKFLSESLS